MTRQYTYPKQRFTAKGIQFIQVFFANGDYFEIPKREIIDIDVQFYDNLVAGERGFCPVAKSGFIKCKIINKRNSRCYARLYNYTEFLKNRKTYLQNRCVNEGGVCYFRLFDDCNWHYPIKADVVATMCDDYLIFNFVENATFGSFDNDFHSVNVCDLTKDTISCIDLDFENCENFVIYPEEIQDIRINFKKQLIWNSGCLGREIESGYLRLKLNKSFTWREFTLHDCDKLPSVNKLERRLCGKGVDDCDICHLYITYHYAGYGIGFRECVDVRDIRYADQPIKWHDCESDYYDDDEEDDDDPCFVSGYAKREKDGSILIVFGKSKQ